MSVNKKMHSRNIFRTSPSFLELGLKYPEFNAFLKVGLEGKVSLDYRNVEALRTLTKILLLEYFGIAVEIPKDTLVPTVPLRLNYVLWLQDFAEFLNISDKNVYVIDIGTGATCIYGLLMCKLRNWKVMALETNEASIEAARTNVNKNCMDENIGVKQNSKNNILLDMLDQKVNYTFTICNPPFFHETEFEGDKVTKTKPPKNAPTGTVNELTCPGGEVAFVGKLIEESKILKEKVSIYSTMIGQKKSLRPLIENLKKANITSYTEGEFCQGNTTRWGLAWTFNENIDLTKFCSSCSIQRGKSKRENTQSFTFIVTNYNSMASLIEKLEMILRELKMSYQLYYSNEVLGELKVNAQENTWSHSRRKRRETERREKYSKELDSLLNLIENYLKQVDELLSAKSETSEHFKTCASSMRPFEANIIEQINSLKNKLKLANFNDFIAKLLNVEEMFIKRLNELKTKKTKQSNGKKCNNESAASCSNIEQNSDENLKSGLKRSSDSSDELSRKHLKIDHYSTKVEISSMSNEIQNDLKSGSTSVDFNIFLNRLPKDEGIKMMFVKIRSDHPNILCEIFNCIMNKLK